MTPEEAKKYVGGNDVSELTQEEWFKLARKRIGKGLAKTRYKEKLKGIVKEYKQDYGCFHCGENDVRALELKNSKQIREAIRNTNGIFTLELLLMPDQVICANCRLKGR